METIFSGNGGRWILPQCVCLYLSLALLGSIAPISRGIADCIDYEDYIHALGAIDTDIAFELALSGHYIYVADGDGGMKVIDASYAFPMPIVGQIDTPGYAEDVAVLGNHAVIADGLAGIELFDISTPTQPTLLGALDTPGEAEAVAIAGNYVYVVAKDVGGSQAELQIVDITNPLAPVLVAVVNPLDHAVEVAVDGRYAYVTDSFTGLHIVDVLNPLSPAIVGNAPVNRAQGLIVAHPFVYMACFSAGLAIANVEDPSHPKILSVSDTPSFASDVTVAGNRAYVAATDLAVFDVSDVQAPKLLGSQSTGGFSGAGVVVHGIHAYVAGDSRGVQVIDISNPANPGVLATLPTPPLAEELLLSGSYAYVVARQQQQLLVVDLSDPGTPSVAGIINLGAPVRQIVLDGQHLYAICTIGRMFVIDVSDPSNPTLLATVLLPENPAAVAVQDHLLYLCTNLHEENDLWVYDVIQPTAPILLGHTAMSDHALAIAVNGDWAYVFGEWDSALHVFDVAYPSTPVLSNSVQLDDEIIEVRRAGSNYYGVGRYLSVIDARNPVLPNLLGRIRLPQAAGGFDLQDKLAYVAERGSGLRVIEVSDYSAMRFVGEADTPGSALDLVLTANAVCIADGNRGLRIMPLQCSTPAVDFPRRRPHRA